MMIGILRKCVELQWRWRSFSNCSGPLSRYVLGSMALELLFQIIQNLCHLLYKDLFAVAAEQGWGVQNGLHFEGVLDMAPSAGQRLQLQRERQYQCAHSCVTSVQLHPASSTVNRGEPKTCQRRGIAA